MERSTHGSRLRWLACAAWCVSLAAWSQSSSYEPDSSAWERDASITSIHVPVGTPLQIELTKGVNSTKAKVGEPVFARLHEDLVLDGWRAIQAGAPVQGSVVEVASGGKKIGGAPRIALAFTSITARDGSTVPINARYERKGESDTTQDAAKVAGGAAAGAVVGHQVDDDKGSVVGGVLGAAAGAAAAKNTGNELKLESGTVLKVTTETVARADR
jgi:Glycine zipper 2TM domain